MDRDFLTDRVEFMVKFVATADQARLLAEATESVEIVDVNGIRLGFFARHFASEEIRIAKNRLMSDEPRLSTAEVIEYLRKLDNQ